LRLPMVPIDTMGTNFDYSLEQLLKIAEGKYGDTNNDREGIVVRPQFPIMVPTMKPFYGLHRLSFKVLNNKFLLKEK